MHFVLVAAAAALLVTACSPRTETAPAEEPMTIEEPGVQAPAASEAPGPVLDPTELDLSKIELAMRIPSAFRAYDEGAYLEINVISPRLGVDIAESFSLTSSLGFDSPFLATEARDGFSIWTYTARPEDRPLLAALSQELVRLKTEAPGENELTFGAIAPGCWNEPEQTPGSLARTLYLRVVPEEDFQVFVPEQILNEGDLPGTETFWRACGG